MNRIRVFGLLLIVSGVIVHQLKLENDLIGFLTGLSVAMGIVFLITGRLKKSNANK